MTSQRVERNDVERANMRSLKPHARRGVIVVGFRPTGSAEAPLISRFQTLEPELWSRRGEIIARRFGKGEKGGRHHHANRVRAAVLNIGVATSIAKEAGDGIERARLQRFAKNVDRCVNVRMSNGAAPFLFARVSSRNRAKWRGVGCAP